MDMMHWCRCCLRCPPDKDLTMPYTYLGKTEIYSDVLKECFNINLILGGNGSYGICWGCVGRLRDASDFKQQVLRSQAVLQGGMVEVEPKVKSEVPEHGAAVFDVLHVELTEKPEMSDEVTGEMLHEDPLVKISAAEENETWTVEGLAAPAIRKPRKSHQKKRTKHIKQTRNIELKLNLTKQTLDSEQVYFCETCAKQFKKRYLLIRHIRRHSPREGYTCHICKKTLLTFSDLKRHKLIHSDEKPFICDQCNKEFTQKGNLDRHKRIHTGERPFNCDRCDRQFASKSNLDRHKRLHTGEKPYMCEKCTKRFYQKGNLRIHKCSVYKL